MKDSSKNLGVTAEKRKELSRLQNMSTPLPWWEQAHFYDEEGPLPEPKFSGDVYGGMGTCVGNIRSADDVAHVVAAVNLAPLLAEEVASLEKRLVEAEAAMGWLAHHCHKHISLGVSGNMPVSFWVDSAKDATKARVTRAVKRLAPIDGASATPTLLVQAQETELLRGLLAIAAQYMPEAMDLTKSNYAGSLPVVSNEVCAVRAYLEKAPFPVPDILKDIPAVKVEGYDNSPDVSYPQDDLILAAICYATAPEDRHIVEYAVDEQPIPSNWPWEAKFWKPSTYEHDLKKARVLFGAAYNYKARKNKDS